MISINVTSRPSPPSSADFSIRIHQTDPDAGPWIDYRRLALVCEGGGQRGIFTAAVLDSFMNYEFFPFHAMIGVSAGAQNLSAYACNAYGYARHAIMHYTTRQEFFNPVRFARGGHLIDLDWYFDALRREAPLDTGLGSRRLAGRTLDLCTSLCDTYEARYLPFDEERVEQSVKASSAIPLLYRRGVEINGIAHCDGGVADPLPVKTAHERGADCIVVIRTVPHATDGGLLGLVDRLRNGRMRHVAAVTERHLQSYQRAQAFIARPPAASRIIEIAPTRPLKSRLLCSSAAALRDDYHVGRACGHAFLDQYAWRLRHRRAMARVAAE